MTVRGRQPTLLGPDSIRGPRVGNHDHAAEERGLFRSPVDDRQPSAVVRTAAANCFSSIQCVFARSATPDFHLIETMRHEGGGRIKSLDLHLDRAGRSARKLGFTFDRRSIETALAQHMHEAPPARVRLRVYRNGAHRIETETLPRSSTSPVRLVVDREPFHTEGAVTCHKTSLRAPYDQRLSVHHNHDDVVLVNEHGHVMETCTANIAVLIGGRWFTPPTASGCLPGIQRSILLQRNIVQERTITPSDVAEAPMLAVVNSLRGWRSAIIAAP